MGDWDWFFASEYGRDKMLRTQVEDLQAVSASADRRSSRLSSQLATLQGSIESRLNALSAAFDAYVELGDVREQLAAHGDTAEVRRDVLDAVEHLVGGRPARPVDPGDTDYWLPHAMNAVLALVAGRSDPEAEARARALSRDADLFVVVLVGALGRGTLVADRVPDLLVTDGSLGPVQVVLWRALLAGAYTVDASPHPTPPTSPLPEPVEGPTPLPEPVEGPEPTPLPEPVEGPSPLPEPGSPLPEPVEGPLLAAVGERWRSTLSSGEAEEWRSWVVQQGRTADVVAELEWIRSLLAGRVLLPLAAPPTGPAERAEPVIRGLWGRGEGGDEPAAAVQQAPVDPRSQLRAVAGTMIAEGSEEERDLLHRARELRRRIEDPAAPAQPGPAEQPRTDVRALVRDAFATTTDPALRGRLLGWLRPGLWQAVEAAAAHPPAPVAPVERRTPGGTVEIGPDGVPPARLAQLRATVESRPVTGLNPVVPGAVAGALVLLALIGLVAGWSGGWVGLLLVAGAVAAVFAVRALRERSRARRETAADLEAVDRVVGATTAELAAADAARQQQVLSLQGLVAELRRELTAG